MDGHGPVANDHAILEQKKRWVRERATLGAHRCERTRIEDHESALIAAWPTSLATVLAGQTTLKVSAAASNARGVATGARLMEMMMLVSCTNTYYRVRRGVRCRLRRLCAACTNI